MCHFHLPGQGPEAPARRNNARRQQLRTHGACRMLQAMTTMDLPTFADVCAAAERIAGHAHRTPVLTSRTLDEELGAQVYGGQVVEFDRYRDDREQITRELAARHGLTMIPPFDHPDVIAGQGTAAKELFEEVGALDCLFVPLGGGGLLAGSALVARALAPNCKVYGVEPEAGNDGQQSLRSGQIVHIPTPTTIADGAQTQYVGQYNFAIIRRDVDDIFTASDRQLAACMALAAERMKLVIEATGCLGLAAARQMKAQLRGKRVGVLVSGGNVDLQRFAALVAGAPGSKPANYCG